MSVMELEEILRVVILENFFGSSVSGGSEEGPSSSSSTSSVRRMREPGAWRGGWAGVSEGSYGERGAYKVKGGIRTHPSSS